VKESPFGAMATNNTLYGLPKLSKLSLLFINKKLLAAVNLIKLGRKIPSANVEEYTRVL
jgi:ABC-type glycerol-3-phosphate transport system substrate-binding protein